MENNNKCFFSISLENGITISGNTKTEVLRFLHEMHSAFFEIGEKYTNKNLNGLANKAFITMRQISDAIETIDKIIIKEAQGE